MSLERTNVARMLCRIRYSSVFLLTALTITAAEAPRLSSDQLAKAVRNESISIPTPGELFAALGKPGKPNWSGQFRGPLPTTYRNRPQIAMNLGGLIADGFIAVEAQDSQQVKNTGSDIIKMAKALGVSEADVIASLEAGDLKGKRIGSQWRLTRAQLAQFLQ